MTDSGLRRWLRISALAACLLLALVAGLSTYRYLSRPVTFTVAAGTADSEITRMMSAVSGRLAANRARVRLKVVEKGSPLESAKAFAAEEVDLAILRGDLVETSAARAVLLVAHSVVLVVAAAGGAVAGMDDLEGKTMGVVEGELNRRVVDALSKEYDLADAKVQFRSLADAKPALQSGEVAALLVVMPVTERYLPVLRELFPRNAKPPLKLLPIEAAAAMSALTRSYERFDLPKGAIRGSPPIPDEDLATLRVPYYLVANVRLDDDRVAELATALLDARRDLVADYPLLGQISTPGSAKDAYIPIHPGAKAYFEGEQKTFFDRYGDQLFYGTLLLGTLTSLLAGAWRYSSMGAPESPLDPLYELGDRVRRASEEGELAAIETELDSLLRDELTEMSRGGKGAAEAAALGLAVQRLEIAINRRRAALAAGAATGAAAAGVSGGTGAPPHAA